MALARWTGVVQDALGNALPNAIVEVRSEQSGALVQLYSDPAGAVALGNPFASASPTVWFHVAGGSYRIKATVGSLEREWRYVSIGTAGELDVDPLREEINAAITSSLDQFKWFAKAVGEYYTADDGVTGVDIPPQDPTIGQGIWIELTAGLTGAGLFNNGKLSGELVEGVAPLVAARAVVSHPQSPMQGQTIRLINTERRMLRPGSPGTSENDQMQRITGEFAPGTGTNLGTSMDITTQAKSVGALSTKNNSYGRVATTATGSVSGGGDVSFDSASSPGARTGTETRPKNIGVRMFRRIG